jgi:tetrapyrrole methylase family protein/MazG family protein
MARLQLSDALDLAQLHHPPLDPDRPALAAQIFSRTIASDVKLTLLNQYPPAHEVIIVRAAGSRSPANCSAVPLAELDHDERFDHLTSLYIPAISALPGVTSFEGFQETIAHLRAPEGCPWDREQTHRSLRETLLEECYEVLTALDEDDMDALREELGDLLMNLVMQVQIATEEEVFRMTDVIADVDAKLKRRHPHVFGAEHFKDSDEVLVNWHAIKAAEKAAKAEQGRAVVDESALAGIAPALPALAQAQKYAHRAHRAGFRWEDREKRLHKVLEELEEVRNARDDAHRREEFGDLIFSIAYWADGYKIDIETASRDANQKFARRFRALESMAREQGRAMTEMSEADLLEIWRAVKRAEQQ